MLNEDDLLVVNIPPQEESIIKVIGVGGGGSNAVNHMCRQGIRGVEFVVCNTDIQALRISPVKNRIQIGKELTEGRGAGSLPERGKQSAIESLDYIKTILERNTKMVFITAGMGGGTGTGAAPIIAKQARELGILTIGIVTIPFSFEGRKRVEQAMEGVDELSNYVDALLIICNEKLRDMYGDLKLSKAFEICKALLLGKVAGRVVWKDKCQLLMSFFYHQLHAALHTFPLIHQNPFYIGQIQISIGCLLYTSRCV